MCQISIFDIGMKYELKQKKVYWYVSFDAKRIFGLGSIYMASL